MISGSSTSVGHLFLVYYLFSKQIIFCSHSVASLPWIWWWAYLHVSIEWGLTDHFSFPVLRHDGLVDPSNQGFHATSQKPSLRHCHWKQVRHPPFSVSYLCSCGPTNYSVSLCVQDVCFRWLDSCSRVGQRQLFRNWMDLHELLKCAQLRSVHVTTSVPHSYLSFHTGWSPRVFLLV